jgi:hypothetical protein
MLYDKVRDIVLHFVSLSQKERCWIYGNIPILEQHFDVWLLLCNLGGAALAKRGVVGKIFGNTFLVDALFPTFFSSRIGKKIWSFYLMENVLREIFSC